MCIDENKKERQHRINPANKHAYDTNLYAVTDFFIKPLTKSCRLSYAQMLNPKGLAVLYFISHHWGEDFAEFVQSILRHAMVQSPLLKLSYKDIVYWCCAFANNQHDVKADMGTSLQDSSFYRVLESPGCKGTVMNLNQMATALQRIWCIYETHLTHKFKKTFVINTRHGPLSEDAGRSDERDLWVCHMQSLLQNIDVAHAEATEVADQRKILKEIAQNNTEHESGTDALNRTVRRLMAGQAIFTLARKGDAQGVDSALKLDIDPNQADVLGVRPLTYAVGSLLAQMRKERRNEDNGDKVRPAIDPDVQKLISDAAAGGAVDKSAAQGYAKIIQMLSERENNSYDARKLDWHYHVLQVP
jgi:hypothetical protein